MTPDDEADDPAINEAVAACVKAMVDLNIDQKFAALDKLGELIEIEEAGFDPQWRPTNGIEGRALARRVRPRSSAHRAASPV